MNKIMFRNNGFSLTELLVVIAVVALLMAGVFGVLSSSVKSFQNTADQGTNIQLARNAMNEISGEIRNASGITTPTGPATAFSYTVPDSVLPINNTNRQIRMGTSGTDVNTILVVNTETNAVIKRIGQGRIKTGSMQFVRDTDNPRVVTVSLIFQSNAYAGSSETPISTVITTMNSGL